MKKEKDQDKQKELVCGIIMPITPVEGYNAMHWNQIRNLIEEAISEIEDYIFKVRMVSESEKISIIQKTIIKNIYNDEMIICDVSTKNPNVMFELGMRLAFNKPVIIIKDMDTNYSFDTGNIRHINYPKTLNYFDIKEFKKKLKGYLVEGYKEFEDGKFNFLKEYGEVKAEELKESKINLEDVLDEISLLRREINKNRYYNDINSNRENIIWETMEEYRENNLGKEEALSRISKKLGMPRGLIDKIYMKKYEMEKRNEVFR